MIKLENIENIIGGDSLNTLLDAIPTPIYAASIYSYEVVYQNSFAKEKFGNALGMKCYKMFQKLDAPCDFCSIPSLINGDCSCKKSPLSWEFQSPIDSRFYLITEVIIKWPAIGDVKLSVLSDITERKREESKIKSFSEEISERYIHQAAKYSEQKNLYAKVFENANIGLVATDFSGEIISCNSAFCLMLDIEKDEILNSNITEHIFKDEKSFGASLLSLISGGIDHFNTDKMLKSSNGDRIYVKIMVTAIKNEAHLKVLVFAIEDVTKERVARAKQIKQARLLESIMRVTPVGICVTNESGKYEYVNKRYCEIYGYKRDELIGESFLKVVPTDLHQELKEMHNRFIDGECEIPSEFRVVTKSEEIRTVFASAGLLKESSSKRYKVTSIQDITEQKEQELMLSQQSKNALMGEMISNIAHQWRQPLSAISSLTGSIKMDLELENLDLKELDDVCLQINENIQYLSKTIEDFRNFFRPEKEQEDVKVNAIFQSAIGILHKTLERGSIDIDIECQDNEISVSSYPREIAQVLIVIIKNSIDAFEDKDIDFKRIILECKRAQDMALITIKDNALGINDEIISKIFDPYFTTKEQKQGTGIGLYMAKKIVEQHNRGKLIAKNIENGACFEMLLPLSKLKERDE